MDPNVLAAENPLVPIVSEIVLALIVFAILFFVIKTFVVPNFEKTFAERTQAIEGGLNAAETKQAEADARLAELEKQLADARHEAARIREEAREQGAQIVAIPLMVCREGMPATGMASFCTLERIIYFQRRPMESKDLLLAFA